MLDSNKIQKYRKKLDKLSYNKLNKLFEKYTEWTNVGYRWKADIIDKFNGEQLEAFREIARINLGKHILIDTTFTSSLLNKLKDLEQKFRDYKIRNAKCPLGMDYDPDEDLCVPKKPEKWNLPKSVSYGGYFHNLGKYT